MKTELTKDQLIEQRTELEAEVNEMQEAMASAKYDVDFESVANVNAILKQIDKSYTWTIKNAALVINLYDNLKTEKTAIQKTEDESSVIGLSALDLNTLYQVLTNIEGVGVESARTFTKLLTNVGAQITQAMNQMAAANKQFKGELEQVIAGKESFILDGTAASFKKTAELKSELEEAGYDVFMLYVYTDLERSLKQNQDRFEKSGGEDRSLAPAIVMRTWKSVTQNHAPYKQLFGNNFVSVANTLGDEKLTDLEDIVTKYLTPFDPKGTKPKTPAQQAKSDARKAKDAEEIKALLSDKGVKDIITTSVSAEEAQSKLKSFLA